MLCLLTPHPSLCHGWLWAVAQAVGQALLSLPSPVPWMAMGSGTGPAVPAQPCAMDARAATEDAKGAFPDLSVYTRSLTASRICFFPPFLYWNSVEPTLLPNKANKFNYAVMRLSEQAPTKLTGIKHLLYTTLNQNLSQFKTMCVVK